MCPYFFLNPFKESDFGEIKKAIFEFYNDTSSYYLIENQFWRGEGEFANFNKHVVILSDEEIHRWSIIFGDLYKNEYGHENYNIYFFDKYWYYFFGRVAIVQFTMLCGCRFDSDGFLYLLTKWRGEWRVWGGRWLWT